MKAVITGGTGLVGTELAKTLLKAGYAVNVFTRSPKASPTEGLHYLAWPADEQGREAVREADVVFNLAGAPVAQRWSEKAKAEIQNSRIDTTADLVDLLVDSRAVLVSASAIGLYPNQPYESVEETKPAGGFLSDVVVAWEAASMKATKNGTRVVCLRIGLVLSKDGGALERLLPIFKLGLGSPVGSGKHWQSWIHINDLVDAMRFAAENSTMSGVYNAVSPNPVTNRELSKALANALGKPFFLPPVPAFMLKLLFGKMSEIVLASQKVSSRKMETNGFTFQHETIQSAMNALFKTSSKS